MNTRIKDNLIYLSAGPVIAGAVTGYFFYADSHGLRMWLPSRFAFRLVTTTILLLYFTLKEMRRERGTTIQIVIAVLFALLAQLGIMVGFHRAVGELPGIVYSVLAVLEMFVVWQASVKAALYFIHSN